MNAKKVKEGIMSPEQIQVSKQSANDALMQLKSRNAAKVALRIDEQTVIYVDPKNATPDYAQNYLNMLDKSRRNSMYI